VDSARVEAAKRLRARLEKARREMDEYGMVLSPETERGYEAVMEAARRSIAALEELSATKDS
jgi:hypothetical protein